MRAAKVMTRRGWQWCATSLGCVALLTGCANLTHLLGLNALHESGLQPLEVQLTLDRDPYRFVYERDDGAGAEEEGFGSGFVVVSQGGKELQAIAHAFEVPRDKVDAAKWLNFQDVNGDGWLDFLVLRQYTADSAAAVMNLYQFEPSSNTFVLVEPLSNLGSLVVSSTGCVELTYAAPDKKPGDEAFCFSPQASRWVKSISPAGAAAVGEADPHDDGCRGTRPSLTDCRKARLGADKDLQVAVRDYRSVKKDALQQALNRNYADSFSRNLDASHAAWLTYRNARCALYVREQALPSVQLNAALEACRFDQSRAQLKLYKTQLSKLGSKKK